MILISAIKDCAIRWSDGKAALYWLWPLTMFYGILIELLSFFLSILFHSIFLSFFHLFFLSFTQTRVREKKIAAWINFHSHGIYLLMFILSFLSHHQQPMKTMSSIKWEEWGSVKKKQRKNEKEKKILIEVNFIIMTVLKNCKLAYSTDSHSSKHFDSYSNTHDCRCHFYRYRL